MTDKSQTATFDEDVKLVREALTAVAKPGSTEWYMDAPGLAEKALPAFERIAELAWRYDDMRNS